MLDEVLLFFCAVVILIATALLRPTLAVCPRGYYAEGVRENGSTVCRTSEPEDDDSDLPMPMQVYCAAGTRPLVLNARTIGCVPQRPNL